MDKSHVRCTLLTCNGVRGRLIVTVARVRLLVTTVVVLLTSVKALHALSNLDRNKKMKMFRLCIDS